MKILNLTTAIPSQFGTGADICSQHFIDGMRALGHSVAVAGFRRFGDSHVYGEDVIEVGERHIETKEAGVRALLWAAQAILRGLPYSSAKYYSRRYLNEVQSRMAEENFDVVILEHSSQLCWLKPVIAPFSKVAILAHNLEHEIFQERVRESTKALVRQVYRREAHLVRKMEDELAATSQGVWALTEHDAEYFRRLEGVRADGVRVFALPASSVNPIDPNHAKTFDLAMIGSWIWKPNADGLRFFFEEVYAHLPAHLSIKVAGRGADWLVGKYPNVEYLGFVPDARKFLSEARSIAISSIRGGGTQLKTLEALGLGLPLVATPFSLRGIATLPSTVRVAESAGQFAKETLAAISTRVTSADLDSVKRWAQDRRVRFLQTIDDSLQDLVRQG